MGCPAYISVASKKQIVTTSFATRVPGCAHLVCMEAFSTSDLRIEAALDGRPTSAFVLWLERMIRFSGNTG